MTKEAPWLELLDSFIKRALRQSLIAVDSPDVLVYVDSRWGRMENLQYLFEKMKSAVERNHRNIHTVFTRQEIQEFSWAYEQFQSFDYTLVKLCYGKISQHIYMLRYSRLMQKELNIYLVKRDSEALHRLFEIAKSACDDSREGKNEELVTKLEDYSELIEEAWIHSLLR